MYSGGKKELNGVLTDKGRARWGELYFITNFEKIGHAFIASQAYSILMS
jgi:hypothetical protein